MLVSLLQQRRPSLLAPTPPISLLLVVVALLGASTHGFQLGLEYQYHYEGWAGTGISDLSSERAVSAIRADLFIQVLDRNETRWQIKDIEFAEQNGFTGFLNYDGTDCLEELQWQPLIDSKEDMETPFLVMWEATSKSKVILTPQNEPAWITNIRRSLIHIFRLPVFEVQNEMVDNTDSIFQKEPVSQQFEHSPQGECLTWYSVMPVMDAHKMEIDEDILGNIEGDIQLDSAQVADLTSKGGSKGRKGSKTSGRKGSKGAKGAKGAKGGHGSKAPPEKLVQGVPALDDSMWRITRTIDFEQCRDLAQYHTVGAPPTGSGDHEDCRDAEPLQRSHNGEFFLRGGPDGIRLERALVKGVYTVDAVGNEAEHLQTFTYQGLNLRSIRNIEEEMNTEEQTYKPVDLKYFADKPTQHLFTEKTNTYIAAFKDYVIKTLRELAQNIETSRRLNVVEELEMISQSQILRYLMKKEDFQEIHNAFKGDDTPIREIAMSLYFKVLSASGTYNPIMYLIECTKNRENDREQQEAHYAMVHLMFNFNAIEDTNLIPHIWDAVKDLKFADLSFSLLAQRLCMNPCNQQNTRDSNCQQDSCRPFVLNNLLPELAKVLNNPDTSLHQKHIVIQALKNLHTADIIEPLKPIVLGTSETNVLIRMHAIFAMKGDNLPRAPREEVFNILNGVFENRHENPSVREAALRMLPHWSPPAAWWYHIAVSSWQEPNKQIASIIYHIISTFASVNDAANRAVSVTKPAPPRSLFYSHILFNKNGGKKDMIRSELLWTLMSNNGGLLPALNVLKLQGGFMNFNFNEFQFTNLNVGGSPWDTLYRAFGGTLGEKDPSAEIVKEMYNEVLENLGQALDYDEEDYTYNPDTANYILFDWFKTEFLFPVNNFDKANFEANRQLIQILINIFGSTGINNGNVFLNSGRYTHTIFTEIGVPLTVQHSEATFLSLSSTAGHPHSMDRWTSEDGKKSDLLLEINFRIDRQESVHMRTTMPWSEHELVAGLKARQELSFPFDITLNIDQTGILQIDMTFKINNKENTGDLLGISNTPFTVVAPIMYSSPYYSIDNYKVIRQGLKEFKESHDILEYTGLTLTSAFEGDIPYFFRRNSWNSFIASLFNGDGTPLMQPTARFYEWKFGINLPKTSVQSFSFTFNYYGAEIKEEEFYQYGDGQGKVDFSEYEQISQQSGSDYYDFGQVSQDIGNFNGEFEQQTTSSKVVGINQEQFDQIHKNFDFPEANKIHSIAFGIELHELTSQRYETILSWATSKPGHPSGSKFQFFFAKRPNEEEPAMTTCLNINTRYPNIPQFATLEDIRDIRQISINAEAFQNPNCEATNPFMSFEGIFKINRDEMEAIFDNQGPDACQPDFNDPAELKIPSVSDATININLNQVPIAIQHLSNQVMDISLWGAFFPYITAYRSDVDNTKDKIVYQIEKQGDGYKISGWHPGMEIVLENLDLPMHLVTPGFSLTTLYNQLAVGKNSKPQCILEETKLRTFDGVTYSHELSNCWSVLARDCHKEQGIILARNAGDGFEARLLWNAAGIMVDMNRHMVMVNGEEVSNDASTDLYQIKYSEEDQSILVQFANDFTIKIADRIMLSMSPTEKGRLCGMCGDMDGEVIGEMKGPNGCIFDEGGVFVNSWSVPGDGCNAFSLRSKQKAVNNYRENCPYNKYYETAEILTVALESPVLPPKSCYNYTYTARHKGGYDCTSMQPVNYCQPGCTPLVEENIPILYECASSPSNQPSSPALASYPKAGCRYYAEFPTILHRGCVPSEKCVEGTSWPHDDGCNTCTCGSNGAIACTMMFCGGINVEPQ